MNFFAIGLMFNTLETASTKEEPSKRQSIVNPPQTEERPSISRMDDYEDDTDIDTDEENK